MLRVLAVLTVFCSPAAFACGGQPCGSSCKMAAHDESEVDDVAAAEGTKAQLTITGMTCGACAAKITEALKQTKGVTAAAVDHETGVAEIAFNADKTNVDALVTAIEKLGKYTATAAEPEA
jgi:copper chaperone